MSSNVREFTMGLDEFFDEAEEHFDRRRRAVMLEAAKGVVMLTPVDKGRARGNWQLTAEDGAPQVTEDTDPNGSATVSRVHGGIEATKGDAYSRHDLVNGLDYIVSLEQGHSKQAPNGMVEVTVNRLRRSGLVR